MSAEEECPGIAGIVQGAQDAPVLQRFPCQFALSRPGTDPQGKLETLCGEGLHDRTSRSGACEGGEQVADGTLHPGVGIQHDLVC